MAKKIWTAGEVIEKIQDEMDLQEETFIDEAEYIEYINEAVDEAEAEIHNLNEAYFNTSSTLDMVAGTKRYNLPLTFYANKLKLVQFKRNSTDMHKLLPIIPHDVAWAEESTADAPTHFQIRNDGTADGVQIEFYPTPRATESAVITLWYIRNAERVTALTDKIDIPEFASFIFSYLKVKVARKELSPLKADYDQELLQQRQLMKETLSNMRVDERETLAKDMSFFNDFDTTFQGYDFY